MLGFKDRISEFESILIVIEVVSATEEGRLEKVSFRVSGEVF